MHHVETLSERELMVTSTVMCITAIQAIQVNGCTITSRQRFLGILAQLLRKSLLVSSVRLGVLSFKKQQDL